MDQVLRDAQAEAARMAKWPSVWEVFLAALDGRTLDLDPKPIHVPCRRCGTSVPADSKNKASFHENNTIAWEIVCDDCMEYLEYEKKVEELRQRARRGVGNPIYELPLATQSPMGTHPAYGVRCRRCAAHLSWVESTYGYCDECREYMMYGNANLISSRDRRDQYLMELYVMGVMEHINKKR